MKKRFFYAICVMALATMVGMISCKKEKEPQVEAEVPQADAQMQAEIDRIVGFKKQVETRKANPGMKDSSTCRQAAALQETPKANLTETFVNMQKTVYLCTELTTKT